MRIVLPDKINVTEHYIEKIKQLGADVYLDLPDENELKNRIRDAEIITASYVSITEDIINTASNLRFIIVPAVGYEWVNVSYAAEKGITVLNCPTFNSQAVAEHAMSLLMAVNRNIGVSMSDLRAGNWNPQRFIGYELAGKQVGLIGYGNIGKRIEKLAVALKMSVKFVNSRSTPEDIDKLVKNSDFVIICAPLTEATKNLLNKHRLRLFKPRAVLVNVGRGAIVDQQELINLLKTNKIRGAGLDVYDGEPLTGIPNETIIGLASLPNVIATPHIGYSTVEMMDKQGAELLANIKSCIQGKPKNVVNTPKL